MDLPCGGGGDSAPVLVGAGGELGYGPDRPVDGRPVRTPVGLGEPATMTVAPGFFVEKGEQVFAVLGAPPPEMVGWFQCACGREARTLAVKMSLGSLPFYFCGNAECL
jgi:hypothetical protein